MIGDRSAIRHSQSKSDRSTVVTLSLLYLAQAAPVSLFFVGLPPIMRSQGASLEMVGATAAVGLPLAFKFVWAPLTDKYFGASGKRRSWITPTLPMLVIALAAMAWISPGAQPGLAILAAILVTTVAAVLSTVTDALAAESLPPDRRRLAGSLQTGAYGITGVAAGLAISFLYEDMGWARIVLGTAAVLLVVSLVLIAMPLDRNRAEPIRATHLTSIWSRFRYRPIRGAILLALAMRLGTALPMAILPALQIDAGLSVGMVGLINGFAANAAMIAAAAGAGLLVARMGAGRTLAVTSIVAGTVSLAIMLAVGTAAMTWAIVLASIAMLVLSSAVMVGLMAHFMAVADEKIAASDLAIQTSTDALLGTAISMIGGSIAGSLGYGVLFAICAAAAFAGAPLAIALTRTSQTIPQVRDGMSQTSGEIL